MAERATVARITRVRFSPSALQRGKMKILFICKYNRFRSQIAENYFRKINKNKKIKSYSAGVIAGLPIIPVVRKTAKELGFTIKGKPKAIQESLLERIDLLVIVANDVPESLFETRVKKIMKCNIPDTTPKDICGIETISKQIMKHVDELNEALK